jgi:hypothetical protein
MPDTELFPAYVRYNATGIEALICRKCLTTGEKLIIDDDSVGLWPVKEPGVVVCARCREAAW